MKYDIPNYNGWYMWEDLKLVMGPDRYERLRTFTADLKEGVSDDGVLTSLVEMFERNK